ncbi:TRAP transporter small permease subunit [Oceanithermus desulfurans]|uniref:C4-dicarboxylate ABC transporter substrate-binding protein n=2 Tax=Oceanithermus desulfurans TaxID=227924 RepID=A0A511RI52_9DEIN|nr:TRAP transporter small permease [Oceanithermus desulfurans]MBB6030376.1 TRAP-type C4-dicarboxylate transport system permease small subunit [Oceanithermus desulfurans]GEM89323.1 C4-dicarboxylate ABC transporter substrate-binding protein [Oceanithermus desulfurans NBRC 100063]
MRSLLRAAEGLATLTGWVAGFLLLLTTGLILFEIALRQLFGRSTLIAEEYSGYFMAGIVYLAAGYTLQKGEHIRVGLLRERLSPAWQRRLDLIAGLLGLAFATLLVLALGNQTLDALHYGTRSFLPSRTPLVYPYATAFAGALVLWTGFVAFMLRRWTGEEG